MSPLINSTPTTTMFGTVSTLRSLVVPFQFSWGGASLVGINVNGVKHFKFRAEKIVDALHFISGRGQHVGNSVDFPAPLGQIGRAHV